GYVYGARAALPYFREQGAGTLVNVSSIVGVTGQPFTSPYVISKFAIRGLSGSLYQELRGSGIHVCTILPASVDTPLFDFSANFSGQPPRAIEPVYPARAVARAIVRALRFPRREIHVGAASCLAHAAHRVAPGLFEQVFASMVEQRHFQDRPAPPTDGNLFEP